MIRASMPLLIRLIGGAVLALVTYALCTLFEMYLPLPMLVSFGLTGGAVLWIISVGADRADHLHAPALDLDVDYALPHA